MNWSFEDKNTTTKLILFVRVLIGLIFACSGFLKLIEPIEYFEMAIGFYKILPERFIPFVAVSVPWLELVFGTYLTLGYWTKGTAIVLTGLSGIFQLVIGQALLRKLPISECGCFGGGFVHFNLYQSFIFDTVLVLILIQIVTWEDHRYTLDNRVLRIFSEKPS